MRVHVLWMAVILAHGICERLCVRAGTSYYEGTTGKGTKHRYPVNMINVLEFCQ